MADNPFQSPRSSEVIGINSGRVEDLRKVATYQRGVLFCILIQILGTIVNIAIVPAELRVIVAMGLLVVALAGTVFVFLLAMHVYSTALGMVIGVLSLVPCLGLLVLLIVNTKATTVLRQNGVKVGLMGADPASV